MEKRRSNTNIHHFNWVAREWRKQPITRQIREHPSMMYRMYIPDHNGLHREVQPIRPPQIQLARLVLSNLLSVDNNNDPLIALYAQTEYLYQLAERDTQIGHEALKLADFYDNQLKYIGETRWNSAA